MQYAISYLVGNDKEGFSPSFGTVTLNKNIKIYPSVDNEPSLLGLLYENLAASGKVKEGDSVVLLMVQENLAVSGQMDVSLINTDQKENPEADGTTAPINPLGGKKSDV